MFQLLWNGSVEMSKKSKFVLAVYICLLLFVAFGFVSGNGGLFIVGVVVIIITAVICGIRYYNKYILPYKQLRAFFDNMFKEMNFKVGDNLPYFLSEEVKGRIKAYHFNTYCPLKLWLTRKDYFEMYLNEKIIDIRQNEKNKRLISLYIELEQLPTQIYWSDKYINQNNCFNIGVCHYGVYCIDLEQDPHAFIAGETGSGKSNILKCFIHQAICKGYDVALIDFKRGVAFSEFSDDIIVHYEYKSAITVLRDMITETNRRLDMFREMHIDNINDYNKISGDYLKRQILFIDELAELLKTRDKEISNILNDSVETLTRLCRAVGIHLIMGIQRPDSTIISGQIKNNVSFRACGRFVDKEPSRIMLGNDMANGLPNIKGRFIVKDSDMKEIQCFYFKSIKPRAETPVKPNPNPTAEKEQKEEKPKPPKEQTEKGANFEFDFSDFKK